MENAESQIIKWRQTKTFTIMQQLEQKDLSTFLIEYHNRGYKLQKPLMLYENVKRELRTRAYAKADHPYREHNQAMIEGKIVKVSDHPELLANDIPRIEYENAQGIIYFTSIPVVFIYDLEYGAYQSRMHQIPYICLMHVGTHLVHADSDKEIDEKCRLYMEQNFDNYLVK